MNSSASRGSRAARGEVLVDDGLDPVARRRVGDDGDAAAANRMTTKRVDQRRIASSSTIRSGAGAARRGASRVRRPRAPTSRPVAPPGAVASSMNEPIGFDGFSNAGSSAATSTCVTTVTACRSIPPANSFLSACRTYSRSRPGCRPRRSQRHLVQLVRASSDRRRMKPTCGPLPCPITTLRPASMICAMWWQVSPAATHWSRTVRWRSSRISELPPIATTVAIRMFQRRGYPPIVRAKRLAGVHPVLGLVETTECGPSITSSVTSRPRSAGRQCM